MGYSCRTLLRDTLVRHSSGTLLGDTLVGLSSSSPDEVASSQLPAPQIPPRTSCTTRSPVLSFQLHRLLRVLKLYHKVASARLHFARSTRTISAEGCAGTGQIALSPAFRALDTHDLRRGLRAHGANRTLACISRTRHARSPQRVARLACISHTRHARSPQRVARQVSKTSVSYETSSKSQAETPIGAHTSRSPAKQFRDSSPSKQHPLTRQSQCDSDIHLYHNSQPHDSLRLPRESHFHASKPVRSPAHATKSDNIIACELQQNLHHTTRLE